MTRSIQAARHEEEVSTERLMERIVDPALISQAIARVKANKGAPGSDGMPVSELDAFWSTHGERIRQVLLAGDYIPRPVKQVTIPKPGGGERKLGIPVVQDRVVQQMMLLALTPVFEPMFSESSFGFRPGRSAHQAVRRAQEISRRGLNWVVDIDLEKFFDRVNHDVLMSRLSRRIADKRVLKLLRRFLNSGVLLDGVVVRTGEGTPQGGPLSPLLANVMLHDLDEELERQGLEFVRYADDCNIYLATRAQAQAVMETVTHFLEVKLRLKVNASKSAVALALERPFPGLSALRAEGAARGHLGRRD